MNRADRHACRAWQLLVKFFFAQREHLPSSGLEFDLSPIQCHVLHLIEPGRPLPMGRLADTLACDASNVTAWGRYSYLTHAPRTTRHAHWLPC